MICQILGHSSGKPAGHPFLWIFHCGEAGDIAPCRLPEQRFIVEIQETPDSMKKDEILHPRPCHSDKGSNARTGGDKHRKALRGIETKIAVGAGELKRIALTGRSKGRREHPPFHTSYEKIDFFILRG